MYEQTDFSPMDKSIFQKYDSNLLFSDAFKANYAYNSPSAFYANSPLGLGNNFTGQSQQYAPQSTFASAALNALSIQGNAGQSTFSMNNNNIMNENTPVRSEHTSLEETQNNLEEQNSAEEEHQAALQAQHNVQSSSTIPNYPNYNSVNNNINSAINSNNPTTGSNNININGSNSMNFTSQQNFILKKNLNEPQLQLPNIQSAATGQYMGNNQQFRYQYQNLEENLMQAHSNYPAAPYYDSIATNNDNLNYGYSQHTASPNYTYQPAPTQQSIQQNNSHSTPSSQHQNYTFTAASSALKKNSLPTNFFYDSPRNYGASFLPYTPPITQQGGQSGFTSFIQNNQLSADMGGKQQQQPQFFGEQEDCSPFNFLTAPINQIEQQQNQPLQQQQQQTLTPQQSAAQVQQAQKSSLNLLQQKKQLQQLQRYNQEKAQLQQQQMQYTEKALLEQQHQSSMHQQQNSQYQNYAHQYPQQQQQQQQQSSFQNFMIPGQKIIPLQPTPISHSMKNANPLPIISETNSKIALQTKKNGNETHDQQNFLETQESIVNEENDQENEQSIDEENQNADDQDDEENEDEEEDDEYLRGSKKGSKHANGSSKVKKNILKSSQRKKALTSISAVSSSSLQNFALGSTKGMTRKQINETKNIPKNYSKAIIGYIQKHPDDCARLLGTEYTFDDFDKFLMDKKEKLTAIKDLRSLWTTQVDDKLSLTFNRVFRILSFKFFRENAVSYIYSSRKIKNTRALITYRFILQRALHDPESFSFMKFQS